MSAPLLRMRGIGKSFPGARVLDGVDLTLTAGEVHVLLGANGAGKSTLMKILCGQHEADEGTIELDGRVVRPTSPIAAERLGILCIHQELSLVPGLSVAANIFLGHEPCRWGRLDRVAMERTSRELLGRLRATIDPRRPAGSLAVAEQQLVEIARALRQRPRVLVMDEPTAALSDREVEALFAVVRSLKADGVSIVYISHRMTEIFELGDRVTVLRDGRSVGCFPIAEVDATTLIRHMIGRTPDPPRRAHRTGIGAPALQLEGIQRPGLGPVTLTVHAGEVVGLGGLVGAGRTEVARAIFGADPIEAGRVVVAGRPLRGRGPAEAIAAGVGFLTEDRKRLGLVLPRSLGENLTLAGLAAVTRAGWIPLARERNLVRGFVDRLGIRATGGAQRIVELSGGNQQKVVLARWIQRGCRVLLLDEPTRGIDVGAKAEIYRLIDELVDQGVAILLISSDLPELLALSDRVAVMSAGRVVDVLAAQDASQERVLSLACGGAP
jgi:ribose transport system ATP-binding protein